MDPMEAILRRKKDEASMNAIVNGLRRQKEVSQLSMLSGDSTLGQFGKGLGNEVDSQMKLKAAMDDKSEQRDMTQGYYDQMAGQNALANTMANRKQTETERHNKAVEALTTNKAVKDINRGVTKLSGTLTKAAIPDLKSGISKIDEELAPYLKNGGDLSGVGGLSNVGGFSFTSDGRKMQARVAKIRNMILKARSGGAVTPQEADRLMQEFSLGVFNTDEEFLASWADFKDSISAGERNIYAGFTDDVVDQYTINLQRQQGNSQPVEDSTSPQGSTVNWSDL